jgi:hypothetical protein
MILSISGIVILAALVVLLVRTSELKVSHAIVCSLFGFYLASTSIAPQIRQGGQTITQILSGIHF